jgi:hypothetical protein
VRVEIVEEADGSALVPVFPPGENYVDLRENPQAIQRIAAARRHLPLRNFLAAVNGAESMFATASSAARLDLPSAASAEQIYEFASQAKIVFAEPSLNFVSKHYVDLSSGLKELLERDAADTVRVLLRISPCDFKVENRRGFCLSIHVTAEGGSPQQAELRWGLGLARVQQALLFRSRALKQQIAD